MKGKKIARLEFRMRDLFDEITKEDITEERKEEISKEREQIQKEIDRTKKQNAYNKARYGVMVDFGLKHTKYGWE